MTTYFDLSVIRTAEELKKAYRRQCIALHPDKGGNEEEFKAMQAEYIRAAKVLGLDTKETRQPLDEWAEILRQCKHTTRAASLRVGDFVHVFDMMEKSNDLRDAFRSYVRGTMEHHDNAEEARKACAAVGKIEAVVNMTDEEADAFEWINAKPAGAGNGGSWGPIEDRQPRGMWDSDRDHQHYYYMVTLIITPSRYFFIDCEGYEYARCIMVPEFFEEFAEFIEERDAYETEKREAEEARQKAEAERLAMESAEVEKWRGLLEVLEPMPARDYRDAASCKAYQKAEAHNKTVLKRNIKTILGHYFPGVKFTITDTSKTWCERSRISWTDGPTVAEVENVAEISRFIAEYYTSDPYADYGEYHSVKAWQQWRELFGAWSDDRVEYERELSAEGEAQAARVIAEYFPEFEGHEHDDIVILDDDHKTRLCVFLGVYSDWSNYANMTEEEQEAANAFDREHQSTRYDVEKYLNGCCWDQHTNRATVLRCLIKYMPIASAKPQTETKASSSAPAQDVETMTEAEAVAAIREAMEAGTITRNDVAGVALFSGRGTYGLKKAFKALGGRWNKDAKAWGVPAEALNDEPTTTTEEATESTEATEPQQEETAPNYDEAEKLQTEEPTAEAETETTAEERDPLAEELAAALRRVEEIRAQMAERDAQRKAEEERRAREAEHAAAIAKAREEMAAAEAAEAQAREAEKEAAARAQEIWEAAKKMSDEANAMYKAALDHTREAAAATKAAAERLAELQAEDITEQPATPSDLEGVDEFADYAMKESEARRQYIDRVRVAFENAAKESDKMTEDNEHTEAVYNLVLAFLTATKHYTNELNRLGDTLDKIEQAHEARGYITDDEQETRLFVAYRAAQLCGYEFGEELARLLFGSWCDPIYKNDATTAAA